MSKLEDPRVSSLPGRLTIALLSTPAVAQTPQQQQKRRSADPASVPRLYSGMQAIVQKMLHSDHGVPIRSHKRRLISAIPSAFTGSDMVLWLMKNLSIESKVEAIHLANMLSRQGFYFCVEGLDTPVRDDNSLFRFQTPYYWPSQNPSVSDFEYGVYLVKQVLRSKHRIRLLDYELNNLHKLKLRLAKNWRAITDRADEDIKIFREQKGAAKLIIGSQEEAFWRLQRPPPGESAAGDTLLSRHYTKRTKWHPQEWTIPSLDAEVKLLRNYAKKPRVHMSTALEGMMTFCRKYAEFDPMLTVSQPSNPWVSGDNTLWSIERSLMECPTERQVRRWACSFLDLLTDVTGRYRFEKFCNAQYCSENIRFWQACRDLKSLPYAAIEGAVKLVYDEFLQHGAVSEVNVSAHIQGEVESDIKNPSRYAFTAAQEQIFLLMQNDIYARFIKSGEYKQLLKQSHDTGSGGKGLFSRFKAYSSQSGGRRLKPPTAMPADFNSPCLPDRFKRRHLSVGRKLSSSGTSSSLDDIFLATSPQKDTADKRRSAYTEAFIEALMIPDAENIISHDRIKHRRVSAPSTPMLKPSFGITHADLDQVFEEPQKMNGRAKIPVVSETMIATSYSANDMSQLQEDADLLGVPNWKKMVGMGGGRLNVLDDLAVNGGLPSVRSSPRNLNEQKAKLLQVTDFGFAGTSPRTQSFEFESIDQRRKMFSSNESIGSASSVS